MYKCYLAIMMSFSSTTLFMTASVMLSRHSMLPFLFMTYSLWLSRLSKNSCPPSSIFSRKVTIVFINMFSVSFLSSHLHIPTIIIINTSNTFYIV